MEFMSAVRVVEYCAQIAANADRIWPEISTTIVLVETVSRVMVAARVHGEGGHDDVLLSGEESSILTPEMAYRHLLGLTEDKLEELEQRKSAKHAIIWGSKRIQSMLAPAA